MPKHNLSYFWRFAPIEDDPSLQNCFERCSMFYLNVPKKTFLLKPYFLLTTAFWTGNGFLRLWHWSLKENCRYFGSRYSILHCLTIHRAQYRVFCSKMWVPGELTKDFLIRRFVLCSQRMYRYHTVCHSDQRYWRYYSITLECIRNYFW